MKTTKEIIAILQGFEAGRKVEWQSRISGEWYPVECLPDIFLCIQDEDEIRLAPDPKIVPYGPEDLMLLRGRWVRSKIDTVEKMIVRIDTSGSVCVGNVWVSLLCLYNNYLDVTDNQDGVPFGKVAPDA